MNTANQGSLWLATLWGTPANTLRRTNLSRLELRSTPQPPRGTSDWTGMEIGFRKGFAA